MNRPKHFFLLLLAILLPAIVLDSNFTIAQNSRSKSKKGSAKYITLSFDTSIAQLGPNFMGHNLKEIYDKIQERQSKIEEKNEFETTEHFEKRKYDLASQPITGKIFFESILAFRIDDCPSAYNADAEVLRIICPFTWAFDQELSSDDKAVQWKFESIDKDPYFGTNAFGATVQVFRGETRYFNIAIKNHADFEIASLDATQPWKDNGFIITLGIKLNEARNLKGKISALLVGKLIRPFVSKHDEYGKPTFDHPFEDTNVHHYLHAFVFEVWFFDFSTGTILAKSKIIPWHKR